MPDWRAGMRPDDNFGFPEQDRAEAILTGIVEAAAKALNPEARIEEAEFAQDWTGYYAKVRGITGEMFYNFKSAVELECEARWESSEGGPYVTVEVLRTTA